jgi:thiosulfate/3-mercaptopyruvate sulfurtransferase
VIEPFLSADEAAALVDRGDVVVADVRWYLDGRSGLAAFTAGHIPGALWIAMDTELADLSAAPTEGRHPLPSPDAFAAAMTSAGIGEHTAVVAYDDTGGMTAGRLVVMLRMLGHDAAVLDGGIGAWSGELEVGDGRARRPAAEPFVARPWPQDRLADADAAAAVATATGLLLDARAVDRFRGEVASIDARPGHVPGASSAPWSAVLDATGHVRPADELRAHYAALGVEDTVDVVASCGSGVSACLNVLALERAGFPAPRLYVASWSGWTADPERPTELGPGRRP